MTPKILLKLGLAMLGLGLSACERQVSFSDDISPILTDACVVCHSGGGEGQAASGLSLETYDDVMAGTSFGAVVVPGSSMSSALYLTVAGVTDPAIHMPPHHAGKLAVGEGQPLSPARVDAIRSWIDQGARNN